MCEIAVLDPEQAGIEAVHQIAEKFNDEQGDGLGVLAVVKDGDKFDYRVYKSINPHWQTLYSFLSRNFSDAWRIVVHGRAATAGDVKRHNAHPLKVECGDCEFDWVVHNGSVRRHSNIRPRMENKGHVFNTGVDSEIIAHKVSELPDTVKDHNGHTYTMRGNLHYLLFSEDGILVRTGSKYEMTDDMRITCSLSRLDGDTFGLEEGDEEWLLAKPTEDGIDIETKEFRKSSYRGRGSKSSYWSSNGTTHSQTGAGRGSSHPQLNDTDDSNDTHTEEFIDHSTWEHIIAVKVAPNVMKVIDKTSDNVEYVRRSERPRLYYWYAPESEPDNIDEMEEVADKYGRIPKNLPEDQEQTSIQDFPKQAVMDAITDETMRVIQEEVLGQNDTTEIGVIHNEVEAAVATVTDAAIEQAATTGE